MTARESLNMVLSKSSERSSEATPLFTVNGRVVEHGAAVKAASTWLCKATAPAIVGLEQLTIAGVREAVRLAQLTRLRLLLSRPPFAGVEAVLPVTQRATVGHLFSCELIIWVGCDGTTDAITRAIAARQLRGSFVPADLATVRRLRDKHRDCPGIAPIGQYQRVGAVLAADCDPRVASQWHQLAHELQDHVRLSILQLPAREAANRYGAIDVVLWLAGLDLSLGGLDFATDPPRPCPHLPVLLERSALDLVIDFGAGPAAQFAGVAKRIHIGPGVTETSGRDVVTMRHGPMREGVVGRVSRCDGQILTLADAASETDDAGAALLRALSALFCE